MKKLSILIYSLGSGGAERQVSLLVKYLAKKYKIYLVLMNDAIFYEVPENVEIVFIEKSNPRENGIKKLLKLPFLALKYKKFLKESKIDVSISFMNRPNYINSLSKILASKGKAILSERISPLNEYKTNSIKDRINRFLIKNLYKKADLVIPNSKRTAFELNKFFNVKNTKVIYNMLEFSKYNKEKYNKEKNEDFSFINVGRFEPQKNHFLLIEAFKKINSDVKLYLIGDGYLREELEKKVKNANLEEKVIFLGRQKNVFNFLSKANCFVLSSNYEGFPNVLIEALACELPIISSDCPSGPREILAPNTDFTKQTKDIEFAEYGILTPIGDVDKLADAMKKIYEDKNIRYEASKKAIKRAKDFEIEKIIKEWENIIEKYN